MRTIKFMALAGALLFAPATFAEQPAESEWAPETFMLDNGMEVIVLPDHRAPVVTHMVWYRVGAIDEIEGKSGVAHLFEHLMFKETDDIPAGEFSKIVARNGGQDNAFTSWDYTAYYQRVARDRLEIMMRMEADRMTDLRLTEDQFIPERDVVKEERRQRIENSPSAILFEKMMAKLFPDHPYGVPIIGFMDEVSALTIEDANYFYNHWYAPENAILVVAGDITAAELEPLAEDIYGAIPRKNDTVVERAWPAVKPLNFSSTVTHSDPKVRQESWDEYWQAPSYSMEETGIDPYALEVGAQILGGGRTSRLYQALVEDQKIAVDAYAWNWGSLKVGGIFSMGASPARDIELDEVAAASRAVLADFIENGPTEDELARAKSNLVASAIFERDSQSSMAELYGSARARNDSLESIEAWPDRIDSVTAEDVRAAFEKYVQNRPSIVTELRTEEE